VKSFGYLLIFILVSCKTQYVFDSDPQVSYIDYSSVNPDSSLAASINPYKIKLDAEMNSVVGYLGENMEKGFPEGKLGNFTADVFYRTALEKLQKDGKKLNESNSFCLINNGGLRVSLQKGQITTGKAFELLPFENTISTVDLSGKEILTGLAKVILAKKGQPVSHNVFIAFKGGKLVSFKLNDVEVDSNLVYTVITNDYMANGGDNMEIFKSAKQGASHSAIKLRDCFIEYLRLRSTKENPLVSEKWGRIIIE
jgi:2',3'-cyclic-nucleotide 2'-phosphodiesterase (5'-nucleotidase family)